MCVPDKIERKNSLDSFAHNQARRRFHMRLCRLESAGWGSVHPWHIAPNSVRRRPKHGLETPSSVVWPWRHRVGLAGVTSCGLWPGGPRWPWAWKWKVDWHHEVRRHTAASIYVFSQIYTYYVYICTLYLLDWRVCHVDPPLRREQLYTTQAVHACVDGCSLLCSKGGARIQIYRGQTHTKCR
jgi:hypothetical protein